MKQGEIYNTGKMYRDTKPGLVYASDYQPNFTNKSIIMNTVSVKKAELVKVLTTNRDIHKKEHEEALQGYLILVTKALKKKLKKVEAGKEFDLNFYNLVKPENHEDDYQNVIDMLGVTGQESVDITMDDYQKYYKNNWSWHGHWHLSNKMYFDAYYASASEA